MDQDPHSILAIYHRVHTMRRVRGGGLDTVAWPPRVYN